MNAVLYYGGKSRMRAHPTSPAPPIFLQTYTRELHVIRKQRYPKCAVRRTRNEKMSQQSLLRSATHGNMTDVVAEVRCGAGVNMRNVLVTRESLWRLCGYGALPVYRYLDDQVYAQQVHKKHDIMLCTFSRQLMLF